MFLPCHKTRVVSFCQMNFSFRAGVQQEKSHRPVGRTIYVISAIMAVLVVAFLSIIVYLKVQHSKCALPRSDRASSGSISKSTQSTLQHPSFDLKQSISEIKSCVFNEVRIAVNFTLLFFHCWSKISQYISKQRKELLSSFHLNGHTIGFYPKTQELEPTYTA